MLVSASPIREPTNLLHFTEREYIKCLRLFSGTFIGMLGSIAIVLLLAVLHEAITALRIFVARDRPFRMTSGQSTEALYANGHVTSTSSSEGKITFTRRVFQFFTKQKLISTLLYGLDIGILLFLILLVVSFNLWLIIGIILGKMLGYALFSSDQYVLPEMSRVPNRPISLSTMTRQ
ncbi:hypothetical protein M3Y94_01173600 [Aphelenchoides besseyi]|nr:hypothetical protein M3Y94_01173600 [Aphelenchoides besseyi]